MKHTFNTWNIDLLAGIINYFKPSSIRLSELWLTDDFRNKIENDLELRFKSHYDLSHFYYSGINYEVECTADTFIRRLSDFAFDGFEACLIKDNSRIINTRIMDKDLLNSNLLKNIGVIAYLNAPNRNDVLFVQTADGVSLPDF
jgi:hypothetical protein